MVANFALSALHKNGDIKDTQSLSGWCRAYLALVVQGSSQATLEAKKRDVQLFLQFADGIRIEDRVQY